MASFISVVKRSRSMGISFCFKTLER